jgi:hypothetical protein
MTHQQLKIFVTTQAILTEVEAMKAANVEREMEGKALAYNAVEFYYCHSQLLKLLKELDNER